MGVATFEKEVRSDIIELEERADDDRSDGRDGEDGNDKDEVEDGAAGEETG